jgi:hypothetical protein
MLEDKFALYGLFLSIKPPVDWALSLFSDVPLMITCFFSFSGLVDPVAVDLTVLIKLVAAASINQG